VGKEDARAHAAIAHLSYNQIVEKQIEFMEADANGDGGDEGRLITEFMDRTAMQLSYEGIAALHQELKERQLAVFYRNGHFSTMAKVEGQLYLLCTDCGFAASRVVWERLDEVNGDTTYCDANFQVVTAGHEDAAMLEAMAVQEQVLAMDAAAGGGDSGLDAQTLLAIQLSQEEANRAAGIVPHGGGGGSGEDADALMAMRLMQEDLQAQEDESMRLLQNQQGQPPSGH